MNASNIKELMINRGEEQKSFLRKLKHLAQQLIGEAYEAIFDFFYEVLEHKSTYKIIKARRCQVLFELFCPIILLDEEVEIYGTFISSNALERHQEELRCKDVSILIVDDVLIHGRGIKRLYEFIDSDYSRENIEVAVFCRSVNAECINEKLESRILKGYLTSFDYEWREISCRFVDFIESSAIPYESFAGGLLSFSDQILSPHDERFTSIANSKNSRIFFEKCTPPPFLKSISYDTCLRTYSNDRFGVISFVPYVFVKNIKKSKCNGFFNFFAQHLSQEHCANIISELLTCDKNHEVYRMRLFSALINRIYGLYLGHRYSIMKEAYPANVNMELCFGHNVTRELMNLRWQDISGLLEIIPPYEESFIQEDCELYRLLLMPDRCDDDAMYRFLSMYYYRNGQIDEAVIKRKGLRRNGLTMGCFYKAVDSKFFHELTAAQIKCWDLGQASGIMRMCEPVDCIAMYGVAGEQNFRFILQENRDYFRKRNKKYTLELSGLQSDSCVTDPPSDSDAEKDSDVFKLFAAHNEELLKQFICDNKDKMEEWYIPQFIS